MAPLPLPQFMAQKLVVIPREGGSPVRFVLNPPQQFLHSRVERHRRVHGGRVRVLVPKARRTGVSTYIAGRTYHRVITQRNQNAAVLAHNDDTVKTLFKIPEGFWNNSPARDRPPKKNHTRQTEMIFDDPRNPGVLNSSYSVAVAGANAEAAKDTKRGSTLQVIHGSEVGYWKAGKATATAILESAEGDGTEVFFESTGNGTAGYFYSMCMQHMDNPESAWEVIFIPWWVDPRNAKRLTAKLAQHVKATLTPDEKLLMNVGVPYEGRMYGLSLEQIAWRRGKIADLNGDVLTFGQEYPTVLGDCFVASGSMFFDAHAVAAMERGIQTGPQPVRYTLSIEDGAPDGVARQRDERGELKVWVEPEPGRPYVVFADSCYGLGAMASTVAEKDGITEHDANAAYVLDPHSMTVVAAYHSYADIDTHADHLWCLGHYYNHALIGVEVNGPGAAVLNSLRIGEPGRRPRYRNLMRQIQIRKQGAQLGTQLGLHTNESTRPAMLAALKALIRKGGLTCWDPGFVHEARSFLNIAEANGRIKPQAAPGSHDDRVMAMAGVVQIAAFGARVLLDEQPDEHDVEYEFAGWM